MKFWNLTFEGWYYPEIIWIWQQSSSWQLMIAAFILRGKLHSKRTFFSFLKTLKKKIAFYTFPGESIRLKCIPSELELFQNIPESVSEPIRKTFYISFDKKRAKINLTPIQCESIRTLIYSDWKFGLNSFELMPWIESDWFLTVFH